MYKQFNFLTNYNKKIINNFHFLILNQKNNNQEFDLHIINHKNTIHIYVFMYNTQYKFYYFIIIINLKVINSNLFSIFLFKFLNST